MKKKNNGEQTANVFELFNIKDPRRFNCECVSLHSSTLEIQYYMDSFTSTDFAKINICVFFYLKLLLSIIFNNYFNNCKRGYGFKPLNTYMVANVDDWIVKTIKR